MKKVVIRTLCLFLVIWAEIVQAEEFQLKEVAPRLYRFTAGKYHGMLLESDKGLLLVDPINQSAASWLSSRIKKEFSAPLRYLVYSHSHFDHTYGAEQFEQDDLSIIAHELVRENFIRTKSKALLPTICFQEILRISLGQDELTLRYHGANNGLGSLSMLFEKQRVLFVVDWIVVGRMPWKQLEGYDIEGMIRSTREVLELDWDVFVGGHAQMGERKDVERYLEYLERLYAVVRDGIIAGKSLEDLQREIRLDEFSDFAQYESWLPLNIEGVYRQLNNSSYLGKREGK